MIGKNEIGSFRRDLPTAEGHCPPPGLKRDNPPLGAADTSAGRQRTRQFWAAKVLGGQGRAERLTIDAAYRIARSRLLLQERSEGSNLLIFDAKQVPKLDGSA